LQVTHSKLYNFASSTKLLQKALLMNKSFQTL
jgi:hypothetical protein